VRFAVYALAERTSRTPRLADNAAAPLAESKKTRQFYLQEGNPAFRVLFRCVEECTKARVLRGDAFAVSAVLWTGIHGAAAILGMQKNFPSDFRQR
jgi:hypothetical protein